MLSSRRVLLRSAALMVCSVASVGRVLAAPTGPLAAIKARGSLRVGVTQAPPWYLKNPKTGEWSGGVGVDMGKAMAAALGVAFVPVEVTWGTAVAALQADKIDIMFVIDRSPEREEAVDFPRAPLFYYSLAILARDDMAISSWEDLNKPSVRISVPQSTTMDRFVTEHDPNASIQRFADNSGAIAAWQSGRADAVCLFHPPLIVARQRMGMGKIVVPTPVLQIPTSAALRKDPDKSFVNWVDEMIAGYYRNGQTTAWYDAFLTSAGIDPKSVPGLIKPS